MSPKKSSQGGRTEQYRFARFILAGGFAALVNVTSRIILNLAMSYEAAIVVAYLCGMTVAYLLNRIFVFFPSGRPVHEEYLRFTLINFVALSQVWIVSVVLARSVFPALGFTWHADTVAHSIGVGVPLFTSYLGHRYFSFAPVR